MKIFWLAAGMTGALTAGNVMAIEEAAYDVVVGENRLEVRDYAPQIVAEVIVNDDFEGAGNQAFRKLGGQFHHAR